MNASSVHIRASQLAVGACCLHAVLFAALHVLQPELSWTSSIISDYTEAGPAATAAFVAFAWVWASLALALGAAPVSPVTVAGRMLLALSAVAILAAAVVPESADPRTGGALASVQNLLARPGLFLAVLLVSVGLRAAPAWSRDGGALMGLAVGSFLGLLLTVGVLLDLGFGGVGQRLLFVALYTWVWLVARGVWRGEPSAMKGQRAG